jgi:hypothetical protein
VGTRAAHARGRRVDQDAHALARKKGAIRASIAAKRAAQP